RHLASPNLAARQLLYFDSILLPDPVFTDDADDFFYRTPIGAVTRIVSQVLVVGTFEAAITSSVDCPLVVFYPEQAVGDHANNKAARQQIEVARDISFEYCKEVFGIQLTSERFALMLWDDSEEVSFKVKTNEIPSLIPPILKTIDVDISLLDT